MSETTSDADTPLLHGACVNAQLEHKFLLWDAYSKKAR